MTPTQISSVPTFHIHRAGPAFARALWVVALCAALTGGFLHQVWRAPGGSARSADAIACIPGHGHAC
jgi:hypothetical protein